MTDSVTQMHQPLTADDWKFIFDVLEGTKLDVPRIRSEVARLQREQAKIERLRADLAILHQTCGDLCDVCGWRFVVPGRGCLNCGPNVTLRLKRVGFMDEMRKRGVE